MPLFEYRCAEGHVTERLRSFANRNKPLHCSCGLDTTRLEISSSHVPPDGVYSYAPNVGDANTFERRHEALRKQRQDTGKRVVLSDRTA